jgi:hypothetical protein
VEEQKSLEEKKKTALSEYGLFKPIQAGQLYREIIQYMFVTCKCIYVGLLYMSNK